MLYRSVRVVIGPRGAPGGHRLGASTREFVAVPGFRISVISEPQPVPAARDLSPTSPVFSPSARASCP
jgi:hypothetical protein